MNMLYEGLKQSSTIVIVPSSAVDTMQLGTVAGLAALTKQLGQAQTTNESRLDPEAKAALQSTASVAPRSETGN